MYNLFINLSIFVNLLQPRDSSLDLTRIGSHWLEVSLARDVRELQQYVRVKVGIVM